MQKHKIIGVFVAGVLMTSMSAHAGWQDMLKDAGKNLPAASGSGSQDTGLTTAEMDGGLKEALAVGAERAINGLSRSGGYLDDPTVRIPLPGMLEKTESALRLMGQEAAVDEFIATVNRAAEKAVPQAASIVGDAVRAMSIADAQKNSHRAG